MKLYRFMSREEYKALAMGKTIISDVDHKKLGRKSTAKGVCLVSETMSRQRKTSVTLMALWCHIILSSSTNPIL